MKVYLEGGPADGKELEPEREHAPELWFIQGRSLRWCYLRTGRSRGGLTVYACRWH